MKSALDGVYLRYSISCMTGSFIKQLREQSLELTQAELARALEVSPVTVNRWENEDPRYKPSDKEARLLEALNELVSALKDEVARRELRDVLRVSTISGVIAKAAIGRLLKVGTITLLAATPGLGWFGAVAGIGVGAALPFFARLAGHRAEKSDSEPQKAKPATKPLQQEHGPSGPFIRKIDLSE